MIAVTGSTCRDYRNRFARRLGTIADTVVNGCPQPLLATWSIAVEQAHELSPAGLSWPALVFASALDTGGIPEAVLTAPAACGYITGSAGAANPGAAALVRAAYANLERLGLVSVDTASAERTVWLPAPVRSAVRAYLAPGNVEHLVAAAATALAEAWPRAGRPDGRPPAQPGAAGLRRRAAPLRRRPAVDPGPPTRCCCGRASRSASPRPSRSRPSGTGRHSPTPAAGCSASGTPTRCWPGSGSRTRAPPPGGWPRRCPSSRRRSPTGRRRSGRSTRTR